MIDISELQFLYLPGANAEKRTTINATTITVIIHNILVEIMYLKMILLQYTLPHQCH